MACCPEVTVAANDQNPDRPKRPSRVGAFFAELQRRRVPPALAAYGIRALAALPGVEPGQHGLGVPAWVVGASVVAVGRAFPVAVTLAWNFGPTQAAGLPRTPATLAPDGSHAPPHSPAGPFAALIGEGGRGPGKSGR